MVCKAFLFIFFSASSVGWDLIQKEVNKKKLQNFLPPNLWLCTPQLRWQQYLTNVWLESHQSLKKFRLVLQLLQLQSTRQNHFFALLQLFFSLTIIVSQSSPITPNYVGFTNYPGSHPCIVDHGPLGRQWWCPQNISSIHDNMCELH